MDPDISKFARQVQCAIEQKLNRKPPYQWCLQLVRRYWSTVRACNKQQKRSVLIRVITPIAALQLKAENRFISVTTLNPF